MELHTLGIDLGKTTFHAVGLNKRGEVVMRKKFSRIQLLRFTANLKVGLIGMESCGGAHFFGRSLREQGHEVLMKNKLARAALIACIAGLFGSSLGPDLGSAYGLPLQGGCACWHSLPGNVGYSSHWDSGWLDLVKVTSFHEGDKLKLKIGGTATKIVVRLLEKGASPDEPVGIDGGIVDVPKSKVVEIALQDDHTDVTQISVHGGINPFGLYPLGGGNGPAALLSAELCAK
jgi:hypothetical protein